MTEGTESLFSAHDRVRLDERLAAYHGCEWGTVHAVHGGTEDTIEVLLDNGTYTCTDPPRLLNLTRTLEAIRQEAATRGAGHVDSAPHAFAPLKRWRNRGRCRHCLAHEELHPALGWLPSRSLSDDGEAIRG